MALRDVRIWPDPALKEIGARVEHFNEELRTLVSDLFETMYKENGVGLAATQVAAPVRVLVVDLDPKKTAATSSSYAKDLAAWGFVEPTAFINPEIIFSEGEVIWEEGCLSLPGIVEPVKRKSHVVVRAQDAQGATFTTEATGLYAVALQHEMDHLDGHVFVEYISKLKRDLVRRKMTRLKADIQRDRPETSSVAL